MELMESHIFVVNVRVREESAKRVRNTYIQV